MNIAKTLVGRVGQRALLESEGERCSGRSQGGDGGSCRRYYWRLPHSKSSVCIKIT